MAPVAVVRTYKGKERKKKGPWANIHNVLSDVKNKDKKESIDAFDALFTKNIKMYKSQKSRKDYGSKENKNAEKLQRKRTSMTNFDPVNLTLSFQDICLDSTFDKILAGPVLQPPVCLNVSHKSKELSSSSINTSGNQCDIKSFASEPSYSATLFPSTCKTRKKVEASKNSRTRKHFAAKLYLPLQLRDHKEQGNKHETPDVNLCLTSTPKVTGCKDKNRTPPLVSPILQCVDKRQKSKISGEVSKRESYQGAVSLSEPCIVISSARKNILPHMRLIDPSCEGSNLFSSSVAEEDVSSSLEKLVSHKLESVLDPVSAALNDPINVIKCVSSQLKSCKADRRIVSAVTHSNQLNDADCDMTNLKESFVCKDLKLDFAKQPCISESVNKVAINESVSCKVVHQDKHVNLRKKKNRESEGDKKFQCRSDDSPGDDLDVHPAQGSCDSSPTEFFGFPDSCPSNGDSPKFSAINEVTEGCKDNRNLSPSKSVYKSVILFDSWDSVNGNFEPTSESPSENTDAIVCGETQVLKSGVLCSHIQTSVYLDNTRRNAQGSAVQNSKRLLHNYPSLKPVLSSGGIDRSLCINDTRFHSAQKSSVLCRQTEGLLCDVTNRHSLQDSSVNMGESHTCNPSTCPQKYAVHKAGKEEVLYNVSKSCFLQESSADADESHISDQRCHLIQETAVLCAHQELLYNSISKSHPLQKSSVDTNRYHESDTGICHTQESTAKEEFLCSDISKSHLLQESSADIVESHNVDQRSLLLCEFAVCSSYKESLCSSASKSDYVQESSMGTDKSHIIRTKSHPTQDCAVHITDREGLLCSDVSKQHLLLESSVLNTGTEKLSLPAKLVKKQKSLSLRLSRRLSHHVVPDQVHFEPRRKSPSFRDVYNTSACTAASRCKSEVTVAVSNEAEEFKLLSINEERSVCVSDTFTARDAVLQRCNQLAPISFSEVFPSRYWLTCKKIGEGVYGEVFLSEGQDKSVLKVIPIEGVDLVNGEPQKKYEDILSEIVIAMELSSLRNGSENRTCSFSEVKQCLCVQGAYPKELIDLWEEYDDNKGSENDSPTMFREDQLYIILVLANGGCDLEAYFFRTADQSHSVFIQTAYALAVAEQVLEFEHRDLHWGNVLISPTTEKQVMFRLCGKDYDVPTKGVKVTIIDFTLSRMTYDGCCIYNDLSKDPALFTAEGDYQFEVYRLMQEHTLNSWHNFKPYTNLLWLHYLLDKMCTMVRYRCTSIKSHKQGMERLKKLGIVLKYTSAQHFILSEVA